MNPAIIIFSIFIVITIILFAYLMISTSVDSKSSAQPPPNNPVKPVAPKPKMVVAKTVCTGSNANNYNLTTNKLKKGETISLCGGLISTDKKNIFVQQSDGNTVIYNTYTGNPIWATNTVNGIDRNGKLPFRFVYQGDSNLVLYDADNAVMWASNTNNKQSDNLIMQEDQNLVLYTGEPIHSGSSWSGPSIWATNTNQ